VLAPSSVQEAADLVQDAFDLADYYRTPVLILGDGLIGQMMEPVEFKEGRTPCKPLPPKTWATTGWRGDRPRAVINSLYLDPALLEQQNRKLQAKYDEMRRDDIRFAFTGPDGDLDLLVVAYGTVARVCQTALEEAPAGRARLGLFRPITLFPFPYDALAASAARAKAVLVVELSLGQMLQDVHLAVKGRQEVHFHGRQGGMLATPDEVAERVAAILAGDTREVNHV
jgi:2-oxoglutarate ferredoxin oxidoreductase subunit alpha